MAGSRQLQGYELPVDETFDDSEDDFYSHRDKILLDEGPAAKRRRKLEEQHADLQPSDEEVFRVADGGESEEEDNSLDDDAAGTSEYNAVIAQQQSEDDEDERFWGTSRKDYYNADVIETEADALEEEAEARRLQQKQLKGMTEADFGFDESAWANSEKAAEPGRPIVEKLPPVQIPENATNDERLAILRTRYPEFEPLANDLVALSPELEQLKVEVDERSRSIQSKQSMESSPFLNKFRALSAYLAAITVYMAVLTSTKDGLAMPPAQIRDHPVMASLLRCRQLWDAVRDMDYCQELDQELPLAPVQPVEPREIKSQAQKQKPTNGIAAIPIERTTSSEPKKKTPHMVIDEEYVELPAVKTKKPRKQKRPELHDILSQAAQATSDQDASDFGDEALLTHEEATEKAKKKKSLRFYTSQIAQKAHKRGAASREAGGDDDVPYKERIRDKQDRLMREAEQRSNKTQTTLDDGTSDDENDAVVRNQINNASIDYYSSIVSKSQQKKADKKARAEAHSLAAREGAHVYEEQHVGADGKRKITYAIEKNKGLVPKRKKEVRNPRVKKKLRYEQKMKKLSSIRPVYKGGEGKGGYGGELTGIKTNVVKSVKL